MEFIIANKESLLSIFAIIGLLLSYYLPKETAKKSYILAVGVCSVAFSYLLNSYNPTPFLYITSASTLGTTHKSYIVNFIVINSHPVSFDDFSFYMFDSYGYYETQFYSFWQFENSFGTNVQHLTLEQAKASFNNDVHKEIKIFDAHDMNPIYLTTIPRESNALWGGYLKNVSYQVRLQWKGGNMILYFTFQLTQTKLLLKEVHVYDDEHKELDSKEFFRYYAGE